MLNKIFAIALLLGVAAFANVNAKFGVNAAFTIGSTWGENNDKFHNSWGPGFSGGANAKFELNSSVSIITGLSFEYRSIPSYFMSEGLIDIIKNAARRELGRDVSTDEIRREIGSEYYDMLFDIDVSFSFKYLDIPLLVRYNVNPQFFVEGGISVGFNLNADMSASNGSNSRTIEFPSKCQNAVEFGAVAGLGYSVLPNLDINFRFNLGFTDMVKGRESLTYFFTEEVGGDAEIFANYLESSYGFKNMRFQMGLTFWFN